VRTVRGLGLAAGVAVAVASRLVQADDSPPPPPPRPAYAVKLDRDIAALAIASTSAIAWFLDLGPAWCAPECNPSGLDWLDRPFAGRYEPAWTTVGTLTAAGAIAAPPLVLFAIESPRAALSDTLVLAQGVMFASALGVVFEVGARRPRPFLYGTAAPLSDRTSTNASLSFYSGHTTDSFAAEIGLFVTLGRLHLAPRWRYLALALGAGAATFVGVSRVVSGDHFPTDVMAGAATGIGFGVLVPALHDRGVTVTPMATPEDELSLAAIGMF
jgi:membrane-associated phospholipid phosphatase